MLVIFTKWGQIINGGSRLGKQLLQWVRGESPRANRARKCPPRSRRLGRGVEQCEVRDLLATILFEGFEGNFPADNNWTVSDTNSAGTTAYWNDVNSSFGGEGTKSGSWKGYVAGTGYSGTSSSPKYQNSMRAEMSRTINLSSLGTASLSFAYKIPSIEPGNYDHLRVFIGSTQVFDVSSSRSTWTQATINLNQYAGGSRTLKFVFDADYVGNAEGAYLDDILVTGEPPADTTRPTATLGAITPPTSGSTFDFSVIYWDNVALNGSTFDGNDIRVTGPNGYSQLATFRSVSASGNGTPRTVIYRMNAPGGSWDFADNGSYLVSLQSSQVADVNGNYAASSSLGTFTVNLSGGSTGGTGDDNDQLSEAISLGTVSQNRSHPSGTIESVTDVDMFKFTVAAGQRIAFDVDQLSSPALDSWLRLFDSSGNQLNYNDDGAAPGEPFTYESYLVHTFATAGTYYVGISGYGNRSYNPTTGTGDTNGSQGGYSLTLSVAMIAPLTTMSRNGYYDYLTVVQSGGYAVAPYYNRGVNPLANPNATSNSGSSTLHNGLDLQPVTADPTQTTVVAPESGTITVSQSSTAEGVRIILRGDSGIEHIFVHLDPDDAFRIAYGVQVQSGAYLGRLAPASRAGTSANGIAHLHYGTRYYGVYVDPAVFYPGQPIR